MELNAVLEIESTLSLGGFGGMLLRGFRQVLYRKKEHLHHFGMLEGMRVLPRLHHK